jgi:hypothetical protein
LSVGWVQGEARGGHLSVATQYLDHEVFRSWGV